MAEKKESKVILEREYVVPLRGEWLKVPQYRRAARAIKALKKFIAKHMKVDERDSDKVKLDMYLNEELWYHGIRRPLAKVKVKCRKMDDGNVIVELAEVPEYVKFKMNKDKKIASASRLTKTGEKVVEKPKEEESKEDKEKEVEKGESVREQGIMQAEKQAKEIKHEVSDNKQIKKPMKRMALQK